MVTRDPPRQDWTVVLRRHPVRIVAGGPEGGYTDVYELICCYCGDDPDLDYRRVSPRLRRIRGPYPVAAGIAAYVRHVERYHSPRGQPDRLARQASCRQTARAATSQYGVRFIPMG